MRTGSHQKENKHTWPSCAAVWTSFSTDSRMVPFFLRRTQSRRPQQQTSEAAASRRCERPRDRGVGVEDRDVDAMAKGGRLSAVSSSSGSKRQGSGHHDTSTREGSAEDGEKTSSRETTNSAGCGTLGVVKQTKNEQCRCSLLAPCRQNKSGLG